MSSFLFLVWVVEYQIFWSSQTLHLVIDSASLIWSSVYSISMLYFLFWHFCQLNICWIESFGIFWSLPVVLLWTLKRMEYILTGESKWNVREYIVVNKLIWSALFCRICKVYILLISLIFEVVLLFLSEIYYCMIWLVQQLFNCFIETVHLQTLSFDFFSKLP